VDALKKKLGPLPLWQWVLIGAVVGAGTILWRRGHPAAQAAQDVAAAATPSDAQYNPIDPTTGLPVSGGVSTGAAATDTGSVTDAYAAGLAAGGGAGGGATLADLLSNFAQLEDLLTGLQEIGVGSAIETDHGAVQQQTGTKRAKPETPAKRKPAKKKTTHAGDKNPGHHVTDHGGRRKTPSSSAPHNPRQHHNVQPPAHQRHDPTKHPSAQHPAAKQPVPAHHTPAAHPPARKPIRRSRR
jgi:hypothetical protein